MERLNLGLKRNNHTFNLILTPFHNHMTYLSTLDGYKLAIRFESNKMQRPIVKYKNLLFSGTFTSPNKWEMFLVDAKGYHEIASFNNEKLHFKEESTTPLFCKRLFSKDTNQGKLTRREAREICLQCILFYCPLFVKIKYKILFLEQLTTFVQDTYFDYETDGKLIKDFKQYFLNFIEAEKEFLQLQDTISFSEILNEFPELKTIKIDRFTDLINESIKSVVKQTQKEYMHMFYSREVVLQEIYDVILQKIEEYKQNEIQTEGSDNENMQTLIENEIFKLKNYKILFEYIRFLINTDEIADEKSLSETTIALIEKCKEFERTCIDCETFNYYKTIELDNEKLSYFEKVENGINEISDQYKEDYIVYKIIMPYYYSALYNKRKTKLKTFFDKAPEYIHYVKNVISVMTQNNILIKTDEAFEFNHDGITTTCHQDILSIQHDF